MNHVCAKIKIGLRFGFSLVELLVVISTITLLLALLIPLLGKAKSMAMQVRCANNLKQIDVAMRLYVEGNDDTYPCAEDPVSTKPYYWLWMGRGWRSFVKPYIGVNVDANNPSVLFCPQDRVAPKKFESTSYTYSMAFYHSPEQIDAMSSPEDTYKNPPKSSVPQKPLNVAKPSGKIIIGEWFSNHSRTKGDDLGWWCWEGSRNHLFVDGQIRFLEAKQVREANDKFPNANLTISGIKGQDWPRTAEE